MYRRRNEIRRIDSMKRTLPATIVLADHDTQQRSTHAHCLRQAGHHVWEAEDGAQALALVRAHEPELLILETWMPILNGLEVLERLVGAPQAAGIKVVMVSKECDADTRLEGFALGVVDYWPREMPAAELRERIDRVLLADPDTA
jgi:DNA-binding response OmpR family regulator